MADQPNPFGTPNAATLAAFSELERGDGEHVDIDDFTVFPRFVLINPWAVKGMLGLGEYGGPNDTDKKDISKA